jgi:hypothetical protein
VSVRDPVDELELIEGRASEALALLIIAEDDD